MKAEVSSVGIIGGGQLGMFLAQACQKIGLITHIYSDTDDAPAKKYANKIIYGSFNDHKKLNEFRKNVDLLTYEFENVAIKTLKQFNKQIKIYPPISALEISQDRKKEKLFFSNTRYSRPNTYTTASSARADETRQQSSAVTESSPSPEGNKHAQPLLPKGYK